MRKQRQILLILFILLYAGLSTAAASGGITWNTLQDGQTRAKAEKKAMIVDFFYTLDCPRCAKLQNEVYENPTIAKKIMDEFIPIRIDLTKKLTREEEALGEKYDYKNDCLLIFIDYDNRLIKDQTGKKLCFIDKVDPDEFIQYLDQIRKTYAPSPKQ